MIVRKDNPLLIPVSLTKQVEPHKKAKENKWWREKVRQTLRINPQFFYKTERGTWGIKRHEA